MKDICETFFRSWVADWGRGNLRAMFSLFYGLWNHVFSKPEFHVLILGVHKAGKTVILLKLAYAIFVPKCMFLWFREVESTLYLPYLLLK